MEKSSFVDAILFIGLTAGCQQSEKQKKEKI